jgi:hypothetical protein
MEHIRISKSGGTNEWSANVGQVALDMLEKKGLDVKTKESVLSQSIDILESCGNPRNSVNNDTGLIIGYVQSGKTLSFTTLSALAAQNGFNVIVVIAGTTTSLVEQTHNRLLEDLEINVSTEVSWKTYKNPTKESRNEIIADLKPGLLNNNPVVLITVMKNSSHLKNLNTLFGIGFDRDLCKVLIIDDEADQASLNTKASKKFEYDVSTIYRLIRGLKRTFINHTYLQYTATPQAPLFISLLDILSPNFVKILTPGDDYTGGKEFFQRNKKSRYPHVFEISDEEVYTEKNKFHRIPDSLVEATMFYFLTVAVGALKGEKSQSHNRTMMVHPSQLKKIHAVYGRWLVKLKTRWLEEFALSNQDPDRLKLIKDFKGVYNEIQSADSASPNFEDVLKQLAYVIEITQILVSNSDSKNKVDFKKDYSRILVGGQVLDRGFTVEGLNVTYMPRSIGVGNADTIQQRCRFFGYKKKYLDLCRIYLPTTSKRAYIDYVTHEEDMRTKLDLLDKESKPLKEFKRMFILSPDLNITRKNVISDDLRRYRLKGWRSIDIIDPNHFDNNKVYKSFIDNIDFRDIPHSINAPIIQQHQDAIISVSSVIDNLLLSLQHEDPSNTLLLNHFLSLLGILMQSDNSMMIRLVNMSKGISRSRSINENNNIKNIFQGSNAKTEYKGDRSVISEELITIQLHNIDIKDHPIKFRTLAIHFPVGFAQSIITLEN